MNLLGAPNNNLALVQRVRDLAPGCGDLAAADKQCRLEGSLRVVGRPSQTESFQGCIHMEW